MPLKDLLKPACSAFLELIEAKFECRMLHSVIKKNTMELEKLVGWYTVQQMQDELHFSPILGIY